MKMQLAPASSTVIPPMSQRQVTQQLKLLNTTPEVKKKKNLHSKQTQT